MRSSLLLLLSCVLVLAGHVPIAAVQQPLAQEESVRPGVNQGFLTPDLEVRRWLQIFEGESREIYRARDQIVAALELAAGMTVADVGAGTGLFLKPLAEAVGPEGRVYAVEIAPRFIAYLDERVQREGLGQVEVVTGAPRTLPIPPHSLDVVFLCDTYHHFEYPKSMLRSLYSALRPGGALVVVDFERIPGVSRKWVLEHVRAGKATAIAEITAAGFRLEEEIEIDALKENYMLRFRRPKEPTLVERSWRERDTGRRHWLLEHPKHMRLELYQRLPEQTRAFLQARGFDPEMAERYAQSCVLQGIMRNPSEDTWLGVDLSEWRVISEHRELPLLLAAEWQERWQAWDVPNAARTAFRWSQLPRQQQNAPGDWFQGMLSIGLPAGAPFDLKVVWYEGERRRERVLQDLQCAEDRPLAAAHRTN